MTRTQVWRIRLLRLHRRLETTAVVPIIKDQKGIKCIKGMTSTLVTALRCSATNSGGRLL